MGQLLVRSLDDRLIQSLKERAARHGRSVEAEHRAILEAALGSPGESFAERAARLRARTPPSDLNSTDLIRWDRDHNYDYDPDEL
jgi:antitoxin FitA